jgi:uncharacterized SAM-binding protein YcdF (DUF218 family)
MGFLLKKILGTALMPLPALVLLGGVGWVLWMRGRRRAGSVLVAAALVALAVLSVNPVSDALVRRVETRAPAFPGDSVDFVVVLGHGHLSDETLPLSAQLSGQGLHRLVEGVAIASAQPWSTLVLSGWGGDDPRPNAEVYRAVALQLGFPEARIHVEPRPRDTAEEAELLHPLLAGRRFALVTSATHMDRALSLFRARALDPVPAPTGHRGGSATSHWILALAPDEENLARTRAAWYETVGRLWVRLTGQAAPPPPPTDDAPPPGNAPVPGPHPTG